MSHAEHTGKTSTAVSPVYFIRKAMNTKFDVNDGWYFDIDWQTVYEKSRATGNWELKTGKSKKKTSAKGKGKADKKEKSDVSQSAKKRRKVVKSLVKDVTQTLPKKLKEDDEDARSSRASSVDTSMVSLNTLPLVQMRRINHRTTGRRYGFQYKF